MGAQSEPSLWVQIAELLLLTVLVALPAFTGLRAGVQEYFVDEDVDFAERFRSSAPPGLHLAELTSKAAQQIGAGCLVVGLQHLVSSVLCAVSCEGEFVAFARHAALLNTAFGLLHIAWSVYVRYFAAGEGQPKSM